MKPTLFALAVALACGARAQAQSFSELALDGRPDRPQRLAAAAKREGALTLYTSIPEKDMAVLAADFDRRYGVKVNVWRASSVKVLQRAAAEARANRWDFDAAAVSSPTFLRTPQYHSPSEASTPSLPFHFVFASSA